MTHREIYYRVGKGYMDENGETIYEEGWVMNTAKERRALIERVRREYEVKRVNKWTKEIYFAVA